MAKSRADAKKDLKRKLVLLETDDDANELLGLDQENNNNDDDSDEN